jgi:VCBS repeat-containing protein
VVDENGEPVASPLGAFTLGIVDQAANNVGWTYSVNDSALDFLAQGETRIQVYTITINDGHTGGNVTQTVTLTITGTNDAPVLTVDQVGGVTEDAANPTLTDSGVLSFTDVDVNDAHIVSKSYNSDASWSGGSRGRDRHADHRVHRRQQQLGLQPRQCRGAVPRRRRDDHAELRRDGDRRQRRGEQQRHPDGDPDHYRDQRRS